MLKGRNRLIYAFCILFTIVLGLGSRKYGYFLPDFIAEYAGDALWALMVFFIFGFIFKEMHVVKLAILSLLFCYLIEFSQLYQADWINDIRNTTLGALILGRGFLWSDLFAYLFGILIGFNLDVFLLNRNT